MQNTENATLPVMYPMLVEQSHFAFLAAFLPVVFLFDSFLFDFFFVFAFCFFSFAVLGPASTLLVQCQVWCVVDLLVAVYSRLDLLRLRLVLLLLLLTSRTTKQTSQSLLICGALHSRDPSNRRH